MIAWRLNTAATAATRIQTLLTGLPSTTGRHGGCRLLIASNGALMVGTGDAAVGTNPQNLTSLGGKTLRLNRIDRRAVADQPLHLVQQRQLPLRAHLRAPQRAGAGAARRRNRLVGRARHQPRRRGQPLASGGNYGWNPVPGYDESTPMTDHEPARHPDRRKWSSGSPTLATSGAAWVRGKQWGAYENTLAVAALKGQRVMFMQLRLGGHVRWAMRTPAALRKYGRLRSVTRLPNGDLMVTTANGDGRRLRAPGRARRLSEPQLPQPRLRVPSTIVGNQTTNATSGNHGTQVGLRHEPAHGHAGTAPATAAGTARSPTTARRWRCRGRGTARTPCRPSPRTPTETPSPSHGETLREPGGSISVSAHASVGVPTRRLL